jgi:hypothetical protein
MRECALFLINCFHHFAEGTSQNDALYSKGNSYYFRKSAAYVKGLHFGVKVHFLKRLLHLPLGGYTF